MDESFEKKGTFINGIIVDRNLNEEISRGKWKFFLLSGVIFFIQGSILFFTIQIEIYPKSPHISLQMLRSLKF